MTEEVQTTESLRLRDLLRERAPQLRVLLEKYGASNPMIFGSVARGDADAFSDIDILVEMDSRDGNLLMRASGLLEETRVLLEKPVDIFPVQLLKRPVSKAALREAIPL